MTCRYSMAPFGSTGMTSVHCLTCRRHVAILPAGSAKVIVDELRAGGAACVETILAEHEGPEVTAVDDAQPDMFEGAA